MKKIVDLLAVAVFPLAVAAQNIGIGTTTPSPSAVLELQASNKGVLIPRLTTAQLNAIAAPANGLLLYNTDSAAFTYRTDNSWLYLKGTASTATPGNISWGITGNAGINAATHFIGTTNDVDLVFKRGGVRAGIINKDLLNTSWGLGSLNPVTTGKENTSIGFQALRDNTNGYENTATGVNALLKNTEGYQNTAYGSGSLIYSTTGFRNTALSTYALFNNTEGYDNTATGYAALQANQTGAGNTAIGSKALSQTKGSNNTGIGYFAGADNVDGSFNVFLGNGAGRYEQGGNKLYISNGSTDKNNTLIYGEFDNKLVSIGGKVGIGRQPALFPLEIQGSGTANDLLQFTNNAGVGKWHLNLLANGSLSFAESGVANNRLVLRVGGSIGVGTATPAASAQLDVSSTTKGFLPPRMTAAQRSGISSPAEGLLVFQTDGSKGYYYFKNEVWTSLTDEKIYPSVIICTQKWMDRNLDVTTYRNGDPIAYVTDSAAWAALTTGAWCYYNNDPSTNATYGKLYNWYAVNDSRGLAPTGWHVPSDAEWTTLETCLGGTSVAGGKMKVTGTSTWLKPNSGATNTSGFAGLPGGNRFAYGEFGFVGVYATWWSATEFSTFGATGAWSRFVNYADGGVERDAYVKQRGFSVRCLRD
jgi:uncharacterized protein (TIGR02145 family)